MAWEWSITTDLCKKKKRCVRLRKICSGRWFCFGYSAYNQSRVWAHFFIYMELIRMMRWRIVFNLDDGRVPMWVRQMTGIISSLSLNDLKRSDGKRGKIDMKKNDLKQVPDVWKFTFLANDNLMGRCDVKDVRHQDVLFPLCKYFTTGKYRTTWNGNFDILYALRRFINRFLTVSRPDSPR